MKVEGKLHLKGFPTASICVAFKLPCNRALHLMIQPHIPQQNIIPLLIQKQLVMPPQSRINLAMLIQIRREIPTAVCTIEEQNHALAYVDEEADVGAAPEVMVSN
jgi:hypothetical protein